MEERQADDGTPGEGLDQGLATMRSEELDRIREEPRLLPGILRNGYWEDS